MGNWTNKKTKKFGDLGIRAQKERKKEEECEKLKLVAMWVVVTESKSVSEWMKWMWWSYWDLGRWTRWRWREAFDSKSVVVTYSYRETHRACDEASYCSYVLREWHHSTIFYLNYIFCPLNCTMCDFSPLVFLGYMIRVFLFETLWLGFKNVKIWNFLIF